MLNPKNLVALQTYVVETICLFEIWFPPRFFNMMTHLIIHLLDELEIRGLVGAMWCYPMERHLSILKIYVRNRVRPKACMVFGYMYDEALKFCT